MWIFKLHKYFPHCILTRQIFISNMHIFIHETRKYSSGIRTAHLPIVCVARYRSRVGGCPMLNIVDRRITILTTLINKFYIILTCYKAYCRIWLQSAGFARPRCETPHRLQCIWTLYRIYWLGICLKILFAWSPLCGSWVQLSFP